MQFDEVSTEAFARLIQNNNGQKVLQALKKRREELVISWIANITPDHGAHMRGRVAELTELIKYLESFSPSKE